jgi:hypothetical protein
MTTTPTPPAPEADGKLAFLRIATGLARPYGDCDWCTSGFPAEATHISSMDDGTPVGVCANCAEELPEYRWEDCR